jgi:transposase
VSGIEIITRRRKWSSSEKAALLAEVDSSGGKVAVVARRHGMSESVLYNWRSARKAASAVMGEAQCLDFVPLGVVAGTPSLGPAMLAPPEPSGSPSSRSRPTRAGAIEIGLPSGVRICVDALVSESALARVLRALRRAT